MIDLYNRYIPQPDGSYRRDRVPEPIPREIPKKPVQKPDAPKPVTAPPCPPPEKPPCHTAPAIRRQSSRKQPQSSQDNILSFFKQLLPKNMDTGDLFVILLLLLMAGDREEDRNNALLTLALYFFM